jgi:hypothetical protein
MSGVGDEIQPGVDQYPISLVCGGLCLIPAGYSESIIGVPFQILFSTWKRVEDILR